MNHLRTQQAAAHLAECSHVLAVLDRALELRQLARAEMKEAQLQPLGAHHELPFAAEGDRRALQARLYQNRLPGKRLLGRDECSLVFVAQRQMKHEIEARAQPELRDVR